MSDAVFGLYPSRDLIAGQRLTTGATFALQRPVSADGVVRFRAIGWLPVPAAVAAAASLRLAPAQLAVRFEPARFEVPLSDRDWFTKVEPVDSATLRIEFAWPAQVAAIPHTARRSRHALSLFRADGKAVADEAAQTGSTGVDLDPPWVGSPLVLEVGGAIAGLNQEMAVGAAGGVIAQARAALRETRPRAAMATIGSAAPGKAEILLGTPRSAVTALTLAGRPSSPRLSLFAESADASTLLWQALLPGEHDTALLPEAAVDVAWAAALEQLRSMGGVERLRLEIESDAPCEVRFEALALGLIAEVDLLDAPQTFRFDGTRAQTATLPLALPAGARPRALRLAGDVTGEAQAGACGDAGPARQGALLDPDHAALQPLDLDRPATLAGAALDWQPLSDRIDLRLRLLADADGRPAARVLAVATIQTDTPAATRLLLRWPGIDLQPQRVWVEVALRGGAGLWPFDPTPGASPGRLDTLGAPVLQQALPQALRIDWLAAADPVEPSRAIAVRLDGEVLAPSLPVGGFELEVPASRVPQLATRPIVFAAGVRGGLTVRSARLEIEL
ncbi:MAG: hypothetical protein ABIX46_05895 [Burkholderiaceae bacterium]